MLAIKESDLVANVSALLEAERKQARAFAEAARSKATIRAYEADQRHFCQWTGERGLRCLPAEPETVALYVSSLAQAGASAATIGRRLTGVGVFHTTAGYENPASHAVVRAVLKGVRRSLGTAQRQVEALGVGALRAMVQATGEGLKGMRDRALLLLGWAGALRRSELVALDVEDLRFEPEGVVLRIRRSKSDQEGASVEVSIPRARDTRMCPVLAVEAWLTASGTTTGCVFRSINNRGIMSAERLSDKAVSLVVKSLAKEVGLDPANYSGHSLRSGFATSAARNGASESAIMRQTRHRSVQVARRYIRQGTRWQDHAGDGLL
jgi:site-specific recombinase XerD